METQWVIYSNGFGGQQTAFFNCNFSNCMALYLVYGLVEINSCYFSNSFAINASAVELYISESTFVDNQHAIYIDEGGCFITNSTFDGNLV